MGIGGEIRITRRYQYPVPRTVQLISHGLSYNSQNEGWYVIQDMETIEENEVLPGWLKN